MEDIIDIIVTETTNTIEITAQPNDEIIDVNIIDNREDIVLNVTPTVVEININSLTSNFGVEWGDITGTLADQTDLNNALALKANLVGGKVPASELPSYVDDVVEVANFAALPATGETGKIYITLDNNKIYRWSGSVYVEIADSTAVWGAITGTLSSQTDLQSALNAKQNQLNGTGFVKASGTTISYDNSTYLTTSSAASTYVPYTGASANVDLGTHTLLAAKGTFSSSGSADTVAITHSSGSGIALNITKGGNGEGIYVNKSSGSGNAVTIVGTLNATTLVKNGGTSSQFLKADGSVDSSTYALDNSVVKLTGNQSVAGIKTFTSGVSAELLWIKEGAGFANPAGYAQLATDITYFHFNNSNNTAFARFLYGSGQRIYTLPNSDGTIALTSNLSAYLPLAGGTMTGAIVGTTASFAMSGSGIALEATGSGTGDAIRITHSSGRALTLNSSGTGFGILINNDTASTSAPFTIQKSGGSVVTLTDAGAGVFASSLRSSGYYLTGMTSGSGALYYNSGANRVTVANYNASGIVVFEVNGGSTALTLNSNLSATFAGSISGTSASFSSSVTAYGNASSSSAFNLYNANGSSGTAQYYADFGNGSGFVAGRILRGNGASGYEANGLNIDTHTGMQIKLNALGGSGGTFAVTGGAATFSSTLQAGAITSSVATGNGSFYINNASLSNKNWTLIPNTSGAETDLLFFYTGASAGTRLTISNTGAATFSSSVTATGATISGNVNIGTSTSATKLTVQDASNTYSIHVSGQNQVNGIAIGTTSGNFAVIQGYTRTFSATNNIALQPDGGNVGIGTTAPSTYSIAPNLVVDSGANSGGITIKTGTTASTSNYGFLGFADGTSGTEQYRGFIQYSHNFNTFSDAMIFGTSGTEAMRITSGGDVFINSTSTINSEKLFVKQSSSSNLTGIAVGYGTSANQFRSMSINSSNIMTFNNGTNEATLTAAGAWSNASDARLKKNIENIKYGLDTILQSQPRSYNRKDVDGDYIGFVAQELMELIPEVVSGDSNSQYCVDYGSLVAVAFKAIKELKAELDTLKNK